MSVGAEGDPRIAHSRVADEPDSVTVPEDFSSVEMGFIRIIINQVLKKDHYNKTRNVPKYQMLACPE